MSDFLNPFAASPGTSREAPGAWALEHPKAWRKVRLGLTLVYARLCATIALTIALFTVRELFKSDDFGSVDFWISLGISLSWLVGLIGQLLCLFVPTATAARPYVISALLTEGLAILLNFVAPRLMLVEQSSIWSLLAISGAARLLSFLSMVLFLLFMRRVAQHMGRYELVDLATRTLIVGSIGFPLAAVGLGGSYFVAMMDMGDLATLLFVVGVAGGIGCLVALVMYAKTMTQLRKAIAA